MSNLILFRPSQDVSRTLRLIADQIDRDELPNETATLILGTEVFHFGQVKNDAEAAQQTIWDCNYAIAKLMNAAVAA